jgi:hypothetical protein
MPLLQEQLNSKKKNFVRKNMTYLLDTTFLNSFVNFIKTIWSIIEVIKNQ